MDLSVLSANLRRLRAAKNLSQTQVAEAAGLSRMGYVNIENGEVSPRVDTLTRMATTLDVRVEELLHPVRVLKRVRFRAKKKMTTREDLIVRVARFLDDYNELEEIVGERAPFRFGELADELEALPRAGRPLAAAARARAVLGLNADDLVDDICSLLEDNGIKVFTPEIASDSFFGLSVAAADGGPAVVVNTWDRIAVERWIFTAAHELGHLLLHLRAYDVEQTNEDEREEEEADLFAASFLMPESRFQAEWKKAAGIGFVDRVLKIKRLFHVSWKTVLYRVADESPEPRDVWKQFFGDYKRQYGQSLKPFEELEGLSREDFRPRPAARAGDEPDHLLPRDFVEDRRKRLVREAIEKELLSMGRAAEILELSLKDMRALAVSWRG
jgi:Zn-dependent peptidase ImmA (M78 family)/DNA-binding XRE family transcriptional regulator